MSQVDQLSQSNGFDFLGFPSIFLRSIHTGQKDFEVSSHPNDYSCCNHWSVESSDSKKTTPAGRICVDFWEMKVNSVTAVFAAEPSDQFSPPIIIRKLSSYLGKLNLNLQNRIPNKPRTLSLECLHCTQTVFCNWSADIKISTNKNRLPSGV